MNGTETGDARMGNPHKVTNGERERVREGGKKCAPSYKSGETRGNTRSRCCASARLRPWEELGAGEKAITSSASRREETETATEV
jgi:hypothetical protein